MELTKRQFVLSLLTAIFIRLSYSAATPDQWQALNATVGGSLYVAVPVAKPCFSQFSPTTQVVIVDSVLYCDAVGADYIEGVR
jgi:hypothetical protein